MFNLIVIEVFKYENISSSAVLAVVSLKEINHGVVVIVASLIILLDALHNSCKIVVGLIHAVLELESVGFRDSSVSVFELCPVLVSCLFLTKNNLLVVREAFVHVSIGVAALDDIAKIGSLQFLQGLTKF